MITVIPQDVYIADTAEVRYVFTKTANDSQSKTDNTLFPLTVSDYTILDASLSGNGNTYTLSIHIIPWKAGEIIIQPLVIDGIQIEIPSITIRSIVQLTQATDIRPIKPPILFPGSLYTLYGSIIGIVCVIILFIFILIKGRPFFKKLYTKLHTAFFSAQRVKKIFRILKHLEKQQNSIENDIFFSQINSALRIYLDKRFMIDNAFISSTTKEIYKSLNTIAGHERNELVHSITGVFMRCDYMRFSNNNDTKQINREERLELFTTIKNIIHQLEEDTHDTI